MLERPLAMTTTNFDMTVEEHIETRLRFLEQSRQEFAVGDTLQGSEKLWGGVSHAVIAIALGRGWSCGSHYLLKSAVRQLADENSDRSLRLAFAVAEKFHANFYHGFMESYQLDEDVPLIRDFVEQLVVVAQISPKE